MDLRELFEVSHSETISTFKAWCEDISERINCLDAHTKYGDVIKLINDVEEARSMGRTLKVPTSRQDSDWVNLEVLLVRMQEKVFRACDVNANYVKKVKPNGEVDSNDGY